MIAFVLSFMVALGIFTFTMIPIRKRWYVPAALGLLIVYGGIAVGVIAISGTPRPNQVDFFTDKTKPIVVLGAFGQQNVAIWVWILPDGATDPIALKFPWDDKAAQQLQDAQREGQSSGANVLMTLPKMQGGLDDREPKFYTMPQQPLPDKRDNTVHP